MKQILMPRLGLTMETGIIATWHVKQQDRFNKGQAIFNVESDKLVNTVEARFDGVLEEIFINEGEECDVGTVVAIAQVV